MISEQNSTINKPLSCQDAAARRLHGRSTERLRTKFVATRPAASHVEERARNADTCLHIHLTTSASRHADKRTFSGIQVNSAKGRAQHSSTLKRLGLAESERTPLLKKSRLARIGHDAAEKTTLSGANSALLSSFQSCLLQPLCIMPDEGHERTIVFGNIAFSAKQLALSVTFSAKERPITAKRGFFNMQTCLFLQFGMPRYQSLRFHSFHHRLPNHRPLFRQPFCL